MPAPTTNDELLELVRKSGVQEEKKLDAYLDKLRASGGPPPEPSKLAAAMVRDGLVTNFQAEQLLLGKWRRFNIGKYRVLERLGSGGMGSVYLCEHKLMRRRVAVKVLPTAKADDPSSLERFYREARAVAALDHPNIVRAYDIDQDDNLHFLVMEYVDGASFQEIVKKVGPLDVLRACNYIRQAAQGLQHAHEAAGLVHRDIKPGNILVDRNGIVKVLDMGLARFFHDEEDILTKKYDENVLGTADYLAPEQAIDSHGVDIRADIYSLGATFYFCLTGKTPFSEGSVAQKLIWHQTRQPKPIRSLRPEVPEGVAAIIEKMMSKEASQRYQTPQAVMDVLAEWAQQPIAPPPSEEMPRLCPAAMGVNTAEPSSNVANVALSGMPSPSPRKNWQVTAPPSSRTPITSASSGPPSPVRGQSSPPPSSGKDSREGISPLPTSNPHGGARTKTAVAALQPTQVESTNGKKTKLPPPPARPPRAAPVEEPVAWEKLAPEAGEPIPRAAAQPKRSKTGMSASGLRPALNAHQTRERKRLFWVLLVVSALALIVLTVVLTLAFKGDGNKGVDSGTQPPPNTIYVGKDSAVRSVAEALKRAKPGYHIIVRDGPIEGSGRDILDGHKIPKDITIEAEPGVTVVWRFSPTVSEPNSLLTLTGLDGFCLRGFTFDGESRVDDLLVLTGTCPGLKLEDLKLQGFKRSAIFIGNLEGTSDRLVKLKGLQISTSQQVEAGIRFDIEPNIKEIPINRLLSITDVRFDGNFKNKFLKVPRDRDVLDKDVKLPQ